MVAPFVCDGAINGELSLAYVEQILLPPQHPGDHVIMDNLACHRTPAVRRAIEAVGAAVLFLPPYSPDLNPIEMAFAKLKSLLRAKAVRTIDQLWRAIGHICSLFSPQECQNYFHAAGYGFT